MSLNIPEHNWILLNVPEYAWKYLDKLFSLRQGCQYASLSYIWKGFEYASDINVPGFWIYEKLQ